MKFRALNRDKTMAHRKDIIFETNKHIYNFQRCETIRYFAKNIFVGKTLDNADEDQSNLLNETMYLKKIKNKKSPGKKPQKIATLQSLYALFEDRRKVFSIFKSGIFPSASIEGTRCPSDLALHLKILIPKQMLQR